MTEPADSSVAAVIVTYRRPEGLLRSITALRAQKRPVQHIYVIDNGGDAVNAALDQPALTILRPGSNTGAAGGFALGLQAALDDGFDWAYLINDDDRPRPEAVGALLELAQATPKKRLAMGWVNLSGRDVPTGAIWKRGLQTPPWLIQATTPYEVDVITFGGLLIPIEAVAKVGLPRSDFFMMWEEYEFCLRLRQAGWAIAVTPQPLVDIDGLPPGSRSAPWRAYYEARNSSLTISSLGSVGDRAWWIFRQSKLALATLPASDRGTRLRMRSRGIADAIRGRTGRIVEP